MASLSRFARIALPIVLLAAAAIGVPLKVLDSRGLERVRRLERDLEDLQEANRKIRRENEALTTEIRSFHSDPGYIERIARDELGMVGPDEVIYQFPDGN
jgi:cell division protein FtsB